MRWLLGILVLLSILIWGGVEYVFRYPGQQYRKWISGTGWNKYYSIPHYTPRYLTPPTLEDIPTYTEDYVQLWKDFPIGNSLMPLPTRHPMFLTVPILDVDPKDTSANIGMIIYSSQKRELARIYTLPTGLYQDHSMGQQLFRLPYFKKRILLHDLDEVWRDIFSLRIDPKEKSLDEMIYDLFILHLRSKLLPKDVVAYGLIKDGKQALIELQPQNKDYKVEVVMTQRAGSVYSYILKTEKNSEESRKLRAKFLKTVSFSPVDDAMARAMYTEFKQLNFSRQVDQEGMLYLLSAYSQRPEDPEMLREMVFYLERGRENQDQLKVVYSFAADKFGKTFTNRIESSSPDRPDLDLQQKIEIENRIKREKAMETKPLPVEPVLSPDEKMNLYLKKAKEQKKTEDPEMTVH